MPATTITGGFGAGGTTAPVNPTTTQNIAINTAETYAFAEFQKQITVQNRKSSGANLTISYNGDIASATNGVIELAPGERVTFGPQKQYSAISIFSDAAVTYGTHFFIKGEN